MTNEALDDAPGPVFRLMYRSRSRIAADARKVELGQLFTAARSNNKRRRLTGALLISDEWFVQVLEGDERVVRSLFTRIQRDQRHDSVTLLDAGPVAGRVFGRWAMAEVAAEGEPDIPLLAHADGISPAAGRGLTPEQEQVLGVMREAMQAGSTTG